MSKTLYKNSNFWKLWLAQVISGIGDILYSVGIMVNVYQYTGSALQTAMVMVASTLPAFIMGPMAGVMVDRYDRKKVLIIMDLIRFGLVLLLLFFIGENYFNLIGLYLVIAGLSIASSFYRPAKMAIIPSIVSPPNLSKANSILIGSSQGIMAIGFGVGGLLTLWLDFDSFIYMNAISFLVSACITYFINQPYLATKKPAPKKSIRQSALDGYHDLKENKVAYPLVVMEIMEYFPHGIWTSAILLVFVEKALQGNADDWGFLAASYFGGMFVGAVLATFANKLINQRTGTIIIINAFLTALFTLGFAYSPTVLVAILVSIVFGIPNSIRDVAQDTLLQSTVPQDLLGRVYSFRGMFTNVMFMISGVLFAWFADFTNIRYIYIAGAAMYLFTAIYALSNKPLRQSRIS